MRLLVVTGRGERSRKILFDALDQLKDRFGRVSLLTPQKDPGPLLEWATLHRTQLSWGDPKFDRVHAVIALPCGVQATLALRYAWCRKIPAVRIHLDGTWIEVGVGWARLLAKHPLKTERAR